MDILALAPVLGWIGLSGVVWMSISGKDTDRQKIEKLFRHKGYGIKDYYPSLIRVIRKDAYNEYVYNVPYGLTDDDDKLKPIEKTLDKPVHIYFDGKLHIRVYKDNLPTKVAYDWQETDDWTVPIGMAQEGMIYHSFDEIPHMTIAGMTRKGKTVLLKLIMGHLIKQHGEDVEFYIIDLKGGLEFARYAKLKQVVDVVSDVDKAEDLLEQLKSKIKADMSYFMDKGYTNILETPIKRRRFVIVDEGAEITKDSETQKSLSHIARVAGALGYRLIFGTQYPTADTLPRQIKQNSDAKISFRLPTEVASRVAIDENGAEKLSCPGRAIYRTHEKRFIQVPYVTDKEVWEKVKQYEVKDNVEERGSETSERIDYFRIG